MARRARIREIERAFRRHQRSEARQRIAEERIIGGERQQLLRPSGVLMGQNREPTPPARTTAHRLMMRRRWAQWRRPPAPPSRRTVASG
jgi:hypothetical protein